ncbi:diaminopropionate ammonia-lyase [Desulfovibrio litoralis]|uniref:Diaminopropionate ammonia-lyase n=1 Tax=Desulfovibrio litoralis DSM 11393 TaxID=1121455 RepID=A0A1M7S9A9_9BACT|nr:diaminopropionate ammonia-lyase [Desulfovibrio litoralis]SHN55033.1 diaminopropionate ammonia-lyase [Desulfovibrio litoralis DSM 11393]
MSSVEFFKNPRLKKVGEGASLEDFSTKEATLVRNFHKSFREYSLTPLVKLNKLAEDFGVDSIFVKDESKRFGLNAFKVLGGSYAIGRLLAQKLNRSIESLTRDELCSDQVHKQLGDITFATATDGNHGRGVAWTAQQLKQKAAVYMPKGSAQIRVDNIRATGATCTVTDLNYDDAVRLANENAEKHGWIMVQDTAWEGYEDIPRWIMQGYMTLTIEALEQLREQGVERPTHVFLQAGVGSFAGAALGFIASAFGDNLPITTIVEPEKADCIYKSMVAADGKPHNVTGDLDTLMAGLACGEPSTISWGVLRDYAAGSISCPDYIAANGMRILSSPLGDDQRVISGESGAVTCGILEYIMKSPKGAEIRKALGLDKNSKVLLISTEGDTSPNTFKEVVWHGAFPEPK